MFNSANQMNMCTKYKSLNNDLIENFHNTMTNSTQQNLNCKSCVHFTSRNCNKVEKNFDSDGHHFFC